MTTPLKMLLNGLLKIANSVRATVLTFLVIIVASAVLYSVCEDWGGGDAVWGAVVPATTVGYGDPYPTTAAGRILAGTLISTMVLLVVPLITAHFASKLIVDQDAFRHEEQEEIKANLRAVLAAVERLEASVRDTSDRPAAPSG